MLALTELEGEEFIEIGIMVWSLICSVTMVRLLNFYGSAISYFNEYENIHFPELFEGKSFLKSMYTFLGYNKCSK